MKKKLLRTLFCLLTAAETSNASPISVPGYPGSAGGTFNYVFASDFTGEITIGVSDEEDDSISSYLDASGGNLISTPISLDTDGANVVDTSAYANSFGESGVDGELFTIPFSALAGDTFSFDWLFSTTEDPSDAALYNDFAFVSLRDNNQANPIHYEVLAEVRPVPLPAATWLFASGLIGIASLRRKSSSEFK